MVLVGLETGNEENAPPSRLPPYFISSTAFRSSVSAENPLLHILHRVPELCECGKPPTSYPPPRSGAL